MDMSIGSLGTTLRSMTEVKTKTRKEEKRPRHVTP